MNVKLIRAIDKWVGVPMCFCASLFFTTCKGGGKRRKIQRSEKPKNILFLELSEMGSTVIAFPAIRYIQKQYPDAALYFLTFKQNRFSVEMLHVFCPDHILTIDPTTATGFLLSTFRAFQAIRDAQIDTIFDLELFSRFSALLAGLSGADRRVGYGKYQMEGLYRGRLMTHEVLYNCHQHMWKNFMALVKSIERTGEAPLVKESVSETDLVIPRFMSAPEDGMRLRERLATINPAVKTVRHLVLMNPSAGSLLPIRGWPIDHFKNLAARIVRQYDALIVLIGLEEAHGSASELCKAIGAEHCINFTGQTSFKDLVDLMNLAHVLVTVDSGPAHFASLTDIHNIVLFGPETPDLYSPLGPHVTVCSARFACSPCLSAYNHRETLCADAKCMSAITVDEVFGAVSGALGKAVKETQRQSVPGQVEDSERNQPTA